MSDTNILVPKSISNLIGESFFIPSYQRGYKWTKVEVDHLLNDIWEFATSQSESSNGKNPFYCLQPIVVKKRRNTENEIEYEVIDGQQRLTTIYLILKNIEYLVEKKQKNFKRIYYQTRKESEKFLVDVDVKRAKDNIDFYHIYCANKAIVDWFSDKAEESNYSLPKATLAPVFLDRTKVIWYEVNDDTNVIDVFTRLNIGKIKLTNSELVKALFLQRRNFEGTPEIKQFQIAIEWDNIEKSLQNDSLWYFLYNGDKEYPNRIEYILDLMKGKDDSSTENHTFYQFNKDFQKSDTNIENIWITIKDYYSRLEEWYESHLYYHLVGYLIAVGVKLPVIIQHYEEADNKEDFTKRLENEISKHVSYDIDELDYSKSKNKAGIRNILLLLNIETIVNTGKSSTWFPFNHYKKDSWDIEHVRSQTGKEILGKDQKKWLKDVLEYYTGLDFDKEEMFDVSKINALSDEEAKEQCILILDYLQKDQFTEAEFKGIHKVVMATFNESETPDTINDIGNLTLLDAYTNRSYKNAAYPIKRRTIINNSSKGIFVPIATKNVFMKIYSKKIENMMVWTESDAAAYQKEIKIILKKYLSKQSHNE